MRYFSLTHKKVLLIKVNNVLWLDQINLLQRAPQSRFEALRQSEKFHSALCTTLFEICLEKLHGWVWKFYILWWLPGNCKWIPISCFFLLQRLKPHNPWTFLPKHISSFKFQKSSALHRILYFTEICKSLNPPSFYTFLFCLIAQRRGQFPLCGVFMFSHLSQCVQIYHPISSKMRNFWPFPFFLCMLTNVEINAWWHNLFIGKEG